MSSLDSARTTQLKNIESKTGRTLDDLRALITDSGLKKHGEIRSMLMEKLKLGYGDANSLVFFALETDGQSRAVAQGLTVQELVDEIYSGVKSELRPLHDKVMEEIHQFGDFEIAPKKGYFSLRRSRQFAMIGPGTRGRLEIGLNIKGIDGDERFQIQPAGGMCQFKVYLTRLDEVDEKLISWIKLAFDQAAA